MESENTDLPLSLKANTLAPVQRQTLEFLREFIGEHGHAPSLKQIAQRISVKSLSTAHFHLERLEQKGFIVRGEDGSLEIIDIERPELSPTAVKLVGTIAAGRPIDAFEDTTYIDVPSRMINGRGEVYCLEVSGNSMIDAHICDGDIVILRSQSTANEGDIVVALLEDNTATLKRYRRLRNGEVLLIPENSTMEPIKVKNCTVQGKLIGVLREYN